MIGTLYIEIVWSERCSEVGINTCRSLRGMIMRQTILEEHRWFGQHGSRALMREYSTLEILIARYTKWLSLNAPFTR
jgi:hypothetical protein